MVVVVVVDVVGACELADNGFIEKGREVMCRKPRWIMVLMFLNRNVEPTVMASISSSKTWRKTCPVLSETRNSATLSVWSSFKLKKDKQEGEMIILLQDKVKLPTFDSAWQTSETTFASISRFHWFGAISLIKVVLVVVDMCCVFDVVESL